MDTQMAIQVPAKKLFPAFRLEYVVSCLGVPRSPLYDPESATGLIKRPCLPSRDSPRVGLGLRPGLGPGLGPIWRPGLGPGLGPALGPGLGPSLGPAWAWAWARASGLGPELLGPGLGPGFEKLVRAQFFVCQFFVCQFFVFFVCQFFVCQFFSYTGFGRGASDVACDFFARIFLVSDT